MSFALHLLTCKDVIINHIFNHGLREGVRLFALLQKDYKVSYSLAMFTLFPVYIKLNDDTHCLEYSLIRVLPIYIKTLLTLIKNFQKQLVETRNDYLVLYCLYFVFSNALILVEKDFNVNSTKTIPFSLLTVMHRNLTNSRLKLKVIWNLLDSNFLYVWSSLHFSRRC